MTEQRQKSIALLIICFSAFSGFSQFSSFGCDFWLAFPKQLELEPLLEITLSSQGDSYSTIEMPGIGFDTTLFVPGGGTTTLGMPALTAVVNTIETVDPRGIHVSSDAPVSVHLQDSYTHTSDGSIVWPTDLLGLNYTIHSWDSDTHPGFFLIIATEDNTSVDITPTTITSGGKAAGVMFNVVLNIGDTYRVPATGNLTGSTVSANKPIAIFSGNECALVPNSCGSCDFLVEQQLPDEKLGTEYLAALTPTRFQDIIQILAIRNGTNIYIDGVLVTTLNAGQSTSAKIYDAVHVRGSEPISVAQFCMGRLCDGVIDTDPSMILLMPTGQLPGAVRFSTINSSNINSHWVSIMVETVGINEVYVNGVNVPPGSFTTVPSEPVWSYAYVPVSSGSHIVESAYSFTAYVSGFGYAESYGFLAGIASEFVMPSAESKNLEFCAEEELQIFSSNPDLFQIWSNGDTTNSILVSDSGYYWVDNFFPSGCHYRDTFIVKLLQSPNVEISTPDPFCPDSGEFVTLEIDTAGLSVIEWSNGLFGNSNSSFYEAGLAWVFVSTYDGCWDSIYVNLEDSCGIPFSIDSEEEIPFHIPSAFTPNGDGLNDLFRPIPGLLSVDNYSLRIFNRWGEVVYYSEDQNAGWDGTFQGKEQEMGTYVFILGYRVIDPAPREAEEVRGSVTLIR